ncbi:MAG: tRNA pseudouridine(38-40) synthase TruA, partial [Gammaproteobacteria bacterium]|nr:tRNA pseudouridine(38-40) synthase TruA [Gammaproteobacteria bacterium]NIW45703.1 tRNA pseudouridine(38-40) synthase TruA [Gammaproteobacteria bacterium]NIX02298.1 tRNA pseudouridine(38-40) synthase TruA [Phycisphaerae bacterium]
ANHPSDVYVRGLNSYLPDDILILDCAETDQDFHARYDAFRRSYFYEITRRPVALKRQYLWYVQPNLNEDTLDETSKYVVGEHDFTSFMHAQSETENTMCVIEESYWEKQGDR